MNDPTELLDYELRLAHHQQHRHAEAESRARADLLAERRGQRRRRLASSFRALADRLDS